MRILVLLLLLSPSLIDAGCGDCAEVDKEIEKETEIDTKYHECRSCKAPTITDAACPPFGFDCDSDRWGITTNVLSATGNCQCLEARCAGGGKLAISVNSELSLETKIRCNSSEWWLNGATVDSMVCARGCNKDACKSTVARPLRDFTQLIVTAATAVSVNQKCATGACPPANGFASVKPDGSLLKQLDPTVTKVTCNGDGKWAYDEGQGEKEQSFVMCNASPCGPSKCSPVSLSAPPEADVVPLIVTGKGGACATATCPDNKFVRVEDNGQVNGLTGITELTCKQDGTWALNAGAAGFRAMCRQPPCKNNCDDTLLSVTGIGAFSVPLRKDCTYTCPGDMGLFRFDPTVGATGAVISIWDATCSADRLYHYDATRSVAQIGCYQCDIDDGPYEGAEVDSLARPIVENCVLRCDTGYHLVYSTGAGNQRPVVRLYRGIVGAAPIGYWYDSERGQRPPATLRLQCLPDA